MRFKPFLRYYKVEKQKHCKPTKYTQDSSFYMLYYQHKCGWEGLL